MSVLDVTLILSLFPCFSSNQIYIQGLCLKLTNLTLFIEDFFKQIFMITHSFTEL